MKNYKIISQLGTGSFGKVQLATHIPTGDQIAIKTISKQKLKTKQDIQMVNKQIAVFKSVNHQNIIKLYEIIEDQSNLYLIMQHADNGDLLTYIKNNGTLSESLSLNLMQQLINAVSYLHNEKAIAHRDIKLANILLTSKNNGVKLADFGLSNFYDKNTKQLKTSCGSPCYSAPEILIGAKYNPLSADIWSLGVVFYAMIEGCLPFYDQNVKQLYKQVIKGRYCQHEKASKPVQQLIKKILHINSQSRITLPNLISQINKFVSVFNNNKQNLLQIPKLSTQSNQYVQNLKIQNIIKILIYNGFESKQVNQTMEYRRMNKKPKKFNQLNTFIQLLEKRGFNKLTNMVNQLQKQHHKQRLKKSSSYLKTQQVTLKRTHSSFTRDTLKDSFAQQKDKNLQKARFTRNGVKQSITRVLDSQRRHKYESNHEQQKQITKQKQIPKQKQHPKLVILNRKKNSSTLVQPRQNRNESSNFDSIDKHYNSITSQVGKLQAGYIRISRANKQNPINLTNYNSNHEQQTFRKSKKPQNNLTFSLSNSITRRQIAPLRTSNKCNQSINQTFLQTDRSQYCSQKQQQSIPIHKGLFNIMHTHNGQVKNLDKLLKNKLKIVQNMGNYKYIVKQIKNKKNEQNNQNNYKIEILQAQNFRNLKIIKIQPYNSNLLYQIKQIMYQGGL